MNESEYRMDVEAPSLPDEAILLREPDLMLAILRTAEQLEAGSGVGLRDALVRLAGVRDQAGEPALADTDDLLDELRRAALMLEKAGAIRRLGDERVELTARGRDLLDQHPDGVDQSVLSRYPEFRAFIAEAPPAQGDDDDPRTPAFDAGMQAFADGRTHTDNPFAFDTSDHLAWECGWSEARDATKRR